MGGAVRERDTLLIGGRGGVPQLYLRYVIISNYCNPKMRKRKVIRWLRT